MSTQTPIPSHLTHPIRTGHGPLAWLAGRIDAWFNWIERREQHRQLQAMDEWQLKDIGVTRADVLREINTRQLPYY